MSLDSITKLKLQNCEYYKEINKRKNEIHEFEDLIKKNKKKIEENCHHVWTKEIQMYERIVSCSVCGLVDWNKSKT